MNQLQQDAPAAADANRSGSNALGTAGRAIVMPLPSKKRQKRNKPTLSCEECVGRKTKVGATASTGYFPSRASCADNAVAALWRAIGCVALRE